MNGDLNCRKDRDTKIECENAEREALSLNTHLTTNLSDASSLTNYLIDQFGENIGKQAAFLVYQIEEVQQKFAAGDLNEGCKLLTKVEIPNAISSVPAFKSLKNIKYVIESYLVKSQTSAVLNTAKIENIHQLFENLNETSLDSVEKSCIVLMNALQRFSPNQITRELSLLYEVHSEELTAVYELCEKSLYKEAREIMLDMSLGFLPTIKSDLPRTIYCFTSILKLLIKRADSPIKPAHTQKLLSQNIDSIINFFSYWCSKDHSLLTVETIKAIESTKNFIGSNTARVFFDNAHGIINECDDLDLIQTYALTSYAFKEYPAACSATQRKLAILENETTNDFVLSVEYLKLYQLYVLAICEINNQKSKLSDLPIVITIDNINIDRTENRMFELISHEPNKLKSLLKNQSYQQNFGTDSFEVFDDLKYAKDIFNQFRELLNSKHSWLPFLTYLQSKAALIYEEYKEHERRGTESPQLIEEILSLYKTQLLLDYVLENDKQLIISDREKRVSKAKKSIIFFENILKKNDENQEEFYIDTCILAANRFQSEQDYSSAIIFFENALIEWQERYKNKETLHSRLLKININTQIADCFFNLSSNDDNYREHCRTKAKDIAIRTLNDLQILVEDNEQFIITPKMEDIERFTSQLNAILGSIDE